MTFGTLAASVAPFTSLRVGTALVFAGFGLSVLSSCGDTQEPVTTTPSSVESVIGSEGGTIIVPMGNDAELQLVFPGGAVLDTIRFTVTPETPEAGAVLRARIVPGDVALYRPVTASVRLRASELRQTLGIYVGSQPNRFFVPTEVDNATNLITGQTQTFFTAATSGVANGVVRAALTGGTQDAELPGFLNIADANCTNQLSELAARIEYAKNYSFSAKPGAYELIQQYKAMQAACEDPNSAEAILIEQEIVHIQKEVCDARATTLDSIFLTADGDEAQFYKRVTRLAGSEAVVVLASADCGSSITFLQALEKSITDYLTAYSVRLNSPGFGGGTWLGLRGEIKSIVKVHQEAVMLSLDDHAEAIIDTILKPALAILHARAYQLCRTDTLAEGNQAYLADVMSGGQVYGTPIGFLVDVFFVVDYYGEPYVPEFIADDVQYCASDLTVEAYDGLDLLTDQTLELGGGDTPGSHVAEGTIEVPVAEGVLSFEGIVRPLRCTTPTDSSTYDASQLVFKFNGATVKTLAPDDGDFLPAVPVELNVSDMYATAGLDPGSPGTYHLEIYREGTGCNEVYGEPTVKLFDISVVSATTAPSVTLIERSGYYVAFCLTEVGHADPNGDNYQSVGGGFGTSDTGMQPALPAPALSSSWSANCSESYFGASGVASTNLAANASESLGADNSLTALSTSLVASSEATLDLPPSTQDDDRRRVVIDSDVTGGSQWTFMVPAGVSVTVSASVQANAGARAEVTGSNSSGAQSGTIEVCPPTPSPVESGDWYQEFTCNISSSATSAQQVMGPFVGPDTVSVFARAEASWRGEVFTKTPLGDVYGADEGTRSANAAASFSLTLQTAE